MFHRMRLAVVGAALVATTPLMAVTATADVAATAAVKQERTITVKLVQPREGVFFAKGRVKPDYKERFAIMQRKVKGTKKWRDWRKFRTTDESRYRERIVPLNRVGRVCYRVKIKGNARFKTSYSDRVCINSVLS